MLFRNNFAIELEIIPETDAEICFAIAQYCAETNKEYEFIKRTHPVIAIIDGKKYEIRKQMESRLRVVLWVLRCKEID